MKKHLLEFIVFVCGASLMVMEIVASRALAPYFGTSTMVWTILIGVIMACLSFGYWYGGKVADKNPTPKTLGVIISIAGISIFISTFLYEILCFKLSMFEINIRASALISTIILFSIPSIALGMVAPYSVKLKLKNIDNAAATVGRLYSISTVGSIIGTFSSGLLLIPFIGTSRILLAISLILIIISLILHFKGVVAIIGIFGFFILSTSLSNLDKSLYTNYLVDTDSSYSRIIVFDDLSNNTRHMRLSGSGSSAMYIDKGDLRFKYTNYYDLVKVFKPKFKDTLFIGGAAYTYPMYYINNYPKATMDVVEIDPKVTVIAKKYFKLKENKRLNIIHQDGRIFLNKNTKKYDAIMLDAFFSKSNPFHLTTIEFVKKTFDSLNEDGCVILNLIGDIDGKNGRFFGSLYKTYQAVYPNVYAFAVRSPNERKISQNIIIVATKDKQLKEIYSDDNRIKKMLEKKINYVKNEEAIILNDGYAPVEYFDMYRFK